MPRRLCLAIGIANAKPLDWLPGAANAARDIAHWARCSGFDSVTLLTDEKAIGQYRWEKGQEKPKTISNGGELAVTVGRIAEEIQRLLPPGEATEWFVLHFAGHGLREDLTRTLWLPSDWSTSSRAVAVERLKFQLESYGIENLTIISDACRDFANRPSTANLTADGVIGTGWRGHSQPALDRFNAVEDGKPAFMVPGDSPGDARCILSGAITNALWGHEPKAFHQYAKDKVISESLLRFIGTAAQNVGLRYGLESKAETIRGYGNDNPDMIYYDRNSPPEPQAPPIVWPPPNRVTDPASKPSDQAVEAALKHLADIKVINTLTFDPGDILLDSIEGGADLVHAIEREGEKGLSRRRKRVRRWRTEVAAGAVTRAVEDRSRKNQQSTIRLALRRGQRRDSGHANLILSGGVPRRIWSERGAQRLGRKKSWVVEVPYDAAAQIVVEYDDGVLAPTVVYPGLDTVAAYDGRGRIIGWMCVPSWAETKSLAGTTDAIARLQTTRLSPSEANELATAIRFEKHANPMLGAIAAYLYDYVGDRENIRRMAWYYADRGQPIPYDVVLLGLMETRVNEDGGLIADIPAVPARPPKEGQPDFVRRETGERKGVAIAGRCPWLRQGWDFVTTGDQREETMTKHLQAALPALLDSSFTALSREGGNALIRAWKLGADR